MHIGMSYKEARRMLHLTEILVCTDKLRMAQGIRLFENIKQFLMRILTKKHLNHLLIFSAFFV